MIRIFFNSPIFSNVKCTYYKCDKYRTVKKNSYHRCSLVPFLFTPPLPSNPIYHQLSHREGFLYLVLIVTLLILEMVQVVDMRCSPPSNTTVVLDLSDPLHR